MMIIQNKTILVIEATGSQGTGIVNSVIGTKYFYVKAATLNLHMFKSLLTNG
ncbi:hypothetical protein SAMN05216464_1156 [Mucilaginibacter pineti]|uniref:Uncharacterized protein n=1 Tax=Mucilaginibacter pineti TaxID=1391627 RepID=A0A1G7JJA5_9SPHI|nr:hypothetical protein SAMN05216464_1156 [Mucilaginibacter pineti]